MSRATHDRTDFHIGIENDYFELLSGPVGALPAGTDLHTALAYIHNWISARETVTPTLRFISANAIVKRTYVVSLTADARITVQVTITGSFTANAIARRIVSSTFSGDAIKRRVANATWGADAWVNLMGVHGASLTADSVIKAAGLTVIQWRSFDGTLAKGNALPNDPMIRLYNKDHFR